MKKVLLAVLVILIVIQFFQPEKNNSDELISVKDISKVHAIPKETHDMLIRKCYDCHSNKTTYPWYSRIQPIAWWLAHHIDGGKGELNFSEFADYDAKKAAHKLEEIGEVVEDGTMPLKPYTIAHQGTEITAEDKQLIAAWLKTMPLSEHAH